MSVPLIPESLNVVKCGSVANRPHYGFRSLVYLPRVPINSWVGIKQPYSILLFATDPKIGRSFLEFYLKLPNYTNNFLWLGFDENDFGNGGSDRLIDAIIAWGDLNAIRNRMIVPRCWAPSQPARDSGPEEISTRRQITRVSSSCRSTPD